MKLKTSFKNKYAPYQHVKKTINILIDYYHDLLNNIKDMPIDT